MMQNSLAKPRCFVMPSPSNPIVYVVDDDAGVLGSLRFLLEADGFDVRTFRSGGSLLKAAHAVRVDCFVIDYKMPDMNGIDLVSHLRHRNIAAPIILITGYPDQNISVRADAAGVHDVLLKPHLEESLVTRIRCAIQQAGAVSG